MTKSNKKAFQEDVYYPLITVQGSYLSRRVSRTETLLEIETPHEQRPRWTETPLDRDPPVQRPLFTEIPLDRDSLDKDPAWTETPWTDITPKTETRYQTETPGQKPSLDRPPRRNMEPVSQTESDIIQTHLVDRQIRVKRLPCPELCLRGEKIVWAPDVLCI